nr:MAG TPA: hypothetical protein [Bacteriophage sp.]
MYSTIPHLECQAKNRCNCVKILLKGVDFVRNCAYTKTIANAIAHKTEVSKCFGI